MTGDEVDHDPLDDLAKVLKRRRPRTRIPPDVLLAVLARDAYECTVCHAAVTGTHEVVVPTGTATDGPPTAERFQTVCKTCQLEPETLDVIIGIDAWAKGWVYVRLIRGRFDACGVSSSIADICEQEPEAHVIACDIPIGLPESGPRLADQEARKFIGPRRNSVFPTLPESVLRSTDYEKASIEAIRLTGRSLSKQSFALASKILEVADCEDPRVFEVHPEVTFREMNGAPLHYSKKSWSGTRLRNRLLNDHGITIPDDLGDVGVVPVDDILDAAAAAWSGRRIKLGKARSLPNPPERSSKGREMAIWY